jgi:hypothetical protein
VEPASGPRMKSHARQAVECLLEVLDLPALEHWFLDCPGQEEFLSEQVLQRTAEAHCLNWSYG